MLSLSCVRAAIVCMCVCLKKNQSTAMLLCCCVSLIFKNAVIPPQKKCGFIFFCYSSTYMKGAADSPRLRKGPQGEIRENVRMRCDWPITPIMPNSPQFTVIAKL